MHELNLLPPHRRRSLRNQAALVSLRHFLDSVLLGAGMTTMAGFALWALLWFFAATASSGGTSELVQSVEVYNKLREEIAERNLFLTEIQTTSTQRFVWSEWLEKFLEAVPQGVDISDLSGHVETGGEEGERITATVKGHASSSRTLDTFTRELRSLPGVAVVDAPLSNLLNPGAYSLNIILRNNGQEE